jgi:hypothetical protein
MTEVRSDLRLELMAGEEAEAIARAVQELNPEAKIEEYPGLLIIRVPSNTRMVIDRVRVEEELGRPYNLRDIQTIMAAFYGYWKETSPDRWVLEWMER